MSIKHGQDKILVSAQKCEIPDCLKKFSWSFDPKNTPFQYEFNYLFSSPFKYRLKYKRNIFNENAQKYGGYIGRRRGKTNENIYFRSTYRTNFKYLPTILIPFFSASQTSFIVNLFPMIQQLNGQFITSKQYQLTLPSKFFIISKKNFLILINNSGKNLKT